MRRWGVSRSVRRGKSPDFRGGAHAGACDAIPEDRNGGLSNARILEIELSYGRSSPVPPGPWQCSLTFPVLLAKRRHSPASPVTTIFCRASRRARSHGLVRIATMTRLFREIGTPGAAHRVSLLMTDCDGPASAAPCKAVPAGWLGNTARAAAISPSEMAFCSQWSGRPTLTAPVLSWLGV